jgi:hypothetical protein
MRSRQPLFWSKDRSWHVDLPTYAMIADTLEPVIPGLTDKNGVLIAADPKDPQLAQITVLVEHPDEYADENTGLLSPFQIRRHHREHPEWDNPDRDWKLTTG